jgi:hypothetical protein
MAEKLIYGAKVTQYIDDVPHIVDNELCYQDHRGVKRAVGDITCCWYSAPGTGHRIDRITRIDEEGVWGVCIEDTCRELTRWDVI